MTEVPASPQSTAQPSVRELAEIPAVEVITRAAVMLMSAAAEKLGLSAASPDDSPHRDLDEARRLITALAGLVTASAEYLGPHAGPVRNGLKSLQLAFHESSASTPLGGWCCTENRRRICALAAVAEQRRPEKVTYDRTGGFRAVFSHESAEIHDENEGGVHSEPRLTLGDIGSR
jgi:uncharacterized protein DUF1844